MHQNAGKPKVWMWMGELYPKCIMLIIEDEQGSRYTLTFEGNLNLATQLVSSCEYFDDVYWRRLD